MFALAIAVSVMSAGASLNAAVHGETVSGAVLAALIAAGASVANTLILTRVRRVQDEVGAQVDSIKGHAEGLTKSDEERSGQIEMLRQLSRERNRQISELNVMADRLSVIGDRLSLHIETLNKREGT